jgi:hypothetical protein
MRQARGLHLETEENQHELTRSGHLIVEAARHAFGQTIVELSPPGSNTLALAATAIAGLFADTICKMSNAADIVEVVNRQLAGAGWQLVPTQRN